MEIPKGDYPIESVPEHNIHDATKVSCFMLCPRLYFYSYILGWQPDAPNIHLEFGAAYHLAMDHLLTHGYKDSETRAGIVLDAHKKFFEHYNQYFSVDKEEENAPKNSKNALLSLVEYTETYKNLDNFEVLHTEVVGTVPIADNVRLHFKIDAIVRDSDGVYLLEHKTTNKDSAQWRAQWTLNTQVSIYTHALYCMFGDEVWGAKVNGIILRKKGNMFVRVPIRKTRASMDTWLWTINHWINMIKWEWERLSEAKPEDPILEAFPVNDQACTKYGICTFLPYCTAWQNPLTRCKQVPPGITVRHWNPEVEHKKTAKKEVRL